MKMKNSWGEGYICFTNYTDEIAAIWGVQLGQVIAFQDNSVLEHISNLFKLVHTRPYGRP